MLISGGTKTEFLIDPLRKHFLKGWPHVIRRTPISRSLRLTFFYIFLITGNFTTNNALKESFNIMNLRFNFTSNKSLLINKFIFSKRLRKHVRSCSNVCCSFVCSCCRLSTTRTNVFSQPFGEDKLINKKRFVGSKVKS